MSSIGRMVLMVALIQGSLFAGAQSGSIVLGLQSLTEAARTRPSDPRSSLSSMGRWIEQIRAEGRRPAFQNAYHAWLWQRSYPYDSPDWSAFARAADVRDRMAPAASGRDMANWQEQGPFDLDTPTRIWHGPKRALTGRVNGIAVSPVASKTLMVATAGGGVWKSTDAGDNWAFKSADWPSLQTTSIAYHPKDANRAYAGTGDSRGFFRLYGRGVFRSADGGETWLTNNNLDGSSVSEIAVDPDNGKILVATSGRANFVWQTGQIYLSDDGITFTAEAAPGMAVWQGVAIGPRDRTGKRNYYAIGFTQPAGGVAGAIRVWMRNGAGVWSDITPAGVNAFGGITNNTAVFQTGVDVAASPVRAGTVYIVSGRDRRVLRSNNSGGAWDNISTAAPPMSDAYNWSQSGYNFFLTCSYTPGGNDDVLYLGQITIAGRPMSTAKWVDLGKTYTANEALTHNDHQALAFAPNDPNVVYIGNDGGVYSTSYIPALKDWTGIIATGMNKWLNVLQFYHGASGPESGQYLGGAQDNATPRSFGPVSPNDALPPSVFRWNNSGSGDGAFSAINPVNALDSYLSINGVIRRTTDGWKDLSIDADGNYVPDSATQFSLWFPNYGADSYAGRSRGALDFDGKTLFYASFNESNFTTAHLFRYTGLAVEDGSPFDRANAPAGLNDGRKRFRLGANAGTYANSGYRFDSPGGGASDRCWVSAVAIAPGDRNTVYVGTSTGRVFVTKNAHASVTAVRFTEITRNLPGRFVSDIVVDANDPNRAWLVVGGTGDTKDYVWTNSNTRTANWTDIDNGLPPISHNTIAIVPGRTNTLYVGNDAGVFVSSDEGATWANATQPLGLPNVQVNKLVMNLATGNLDAFTFGRGVWSLALGENRLVGFGVQDLTFNGARANVQGRIVLNKPVAADTDVLLSTDEPTVFVLPAKTTIKRGENSATFTMNVVPNGTTSAFIAAEMGSDLWTFIVTSNP